MSHRLICCRQTAGETQMNFVFQNLSVQSMEQYEYECFGMDIKTILVMREALICRWYKKNID